jgi:plasmid stabilization system protein ParE
VKVLWTEPAASEFRRLSLHLQRSVLNRLEVISEFPEMYPVRQHQPYEGFRFFVVENYCLSYVVAEDTVIILALFPARRGT